MSNRIPPDPWPCFASGEWTGSLRQLSDETCPPQGVPVVYWLYDQDMMLLYIGSTNHAYARFKQHLADKPWRYYDAAQCPDRDTAFWLEAQQVRRYRPRLNRDLTVNGRGRLVPVEPEPEPLSEPLHLPLPTDFPDCGHLFPTIDCCDWSSPVCMAHWRAELDLHHSEPESRGYVA